MLAVIRFGGSTAGAETVDDTRDLSCPQSWEAGRIATSWVASGGTVRQRAIGKKLVVLAWACRCRPPAHRRARCHQPEIAALHRWCAADYLLCTCTSGQLRAASSETMPTGAAEIGGASAACKVAHKLIAAERPLANRWCGLRQRSVPAPKNANVIIEISAHVHRLYHLLGFPYYNLLSGAAAQAGSRRQYSCSTARKVVAPIF